MREDRLEFKRNSSQSRRILLTLDSSCRNILGDKVFPYYKLGWPFEYGALEFTTLQGKLFNGGTFMATKKKAKKKKH